jgi:hypothetical protein
MHRHYFINRSRRKEDPPRGSGEFYSPNGHARGTPATNSTDSATHARRLPHLRPLFVCGIQWLFLYLNRTQIVLC